MSKTETCYSLVCQTVEEFSESEAIQEVGCCLLWKFTSGGQKTCTQYMKRTDFMRCSFGLDSHWKCHGNQVHPAPTSTSEAITL